jgi:RNA polymerase sigma-70 factor (ECF subfamily)
MSHAQERFRALVEAYADDLYRFAVWLCHDRQRAEDLAQETFLRAWRAIDTLRDEKAARPWLITILRREYARSFERLNPPLDPIDDELVADHPELPELPVLRRSLALLAPEYREPLLMQVLGGMNIDEISAELDLPPGTVMTRLFRARQKLRDALAGNKVARSASP